MAKSDRSVTLTPFFSPLLSELDPVSRHCVNSRRGRSIASLRQTEENLYRRCAIEQTRVDGILVRSGFADFGHFSATLC